MESKQPLKRHKALQPLSREHHYGLLLGWKIRTGFAKGIAVERMKGYADWFFQQHLAAHFDLEEKHVFPLLGMDHPMVLQAMHEHAQLRQLFAAADDLSYQLSQIEALLEAHIRFEERVLFQEIQNVATEEQLAEVERLHGGDLLKDDWKDRFWEA
jgi:hemerythrin-like domain-containing protein